MLRTRGVAMITLDGTLGQPMVTSGTLQAAESTCCAANDSLPTSNSFDKNSTISEKDSTILVQVLERLHKLEKHNMWQVNLVHRVRNGIGHSAPQGPAPKKTLPKAQRTRGLSSSCQSHIASSNTNLDRISSSES